MNESIYICPPKDRDEAAGRLVDLFAQLMEFAHFGSQMRQSAKRYAAELLRLLDGEMKREVTK